MNENARPITLSRRVARLLLRFRYPIIAITILISFFFVYKSFQMDVVPNLSNMLPQKHPFIQVHNEIRERFGGVNTFVIEVSVHEGTIFNETTLKKVERITEKLLKMHHIDKYKVMSLASRKVKDMRVGAWGIEIVPIIYPQVPNDDSPEMAKLKEAVYANDFVVGNLVSFDGKSALIRGEFLERPEVDYRYILREFNKIIDEEGDENHTIRITGMPLLLGLIYRSFGQMFAIFGVTLVIIMALFYVYFRSFRAMLSPIIASLTSIIWTIGFAGLTGRDLDPMTIVIPFLILAIGASHTAQKTKRYYEEYLEKGDVMSAAEETIAWLIGPSVAAIATDAVAFMSLYLIPIKMIQDMSVVSCIGVVSIVFTDLALVPLLFTILPPPNTTATR